MSCVIVDGKCWDRIRSFAFAGSQSLFQEVKEARFRGAYHDFDKLGDKPIIFDASVEANHLYALYLRATTGEELTGLKRPVELAAVALGQLDFRMKEEKLRNKELLLGRVYDLCSDRPPE